MSGERVGSRSCEPTREPSPTLQRSHSVIPVRQRALLLTLPLLLAAGGCGLATSPHGSIGIQPTGPRVSDGGEPAPLAATAAQLVSGRWSTLPRAPIAPRDGPSVVWTGHELLVWGGSSGDQEQDLHGDGAAYDPAADRWRVLPASPLSPREGQSAVWTGREMVIWGGYDRVGSNVSMHVTGDGAAYEPATNRWRMLPAAPLSPRAQAIVVWTGSEMILLGGIPAVVTDSHPGYGDGAAYDPATNSWQLLSKPVPPQRHPLTWRTAIQADGELLAWSEWGISKKTGPNTYTEAGGVDLFAYLERTGTCHLVPKAPGALPDAEEVLWTGRLAVVRGITYNCGLCPGPYVPEVTDLYDPSGNTWTRTAEDPLAGDHLASAWTGAALFSFDDGFSSSGPHGAVVPGDASVYDPSSGRWQRLPTAPSGCQTGSGDQPTWTGHSVIFYCPSTGSGPAGLAYTIGP